MRALDAVAVAPDATSTLPSITAPSSSFAPLPSVWTVEPSSSTVPDAPAEPYVPVDTAPVPEPLDRARLPRAATDSTLPSFSTGTVMKLVVAVAVELPTVLRRMPEARLTNRGVPLNEMPRSADAISTVPALSNTRVSHSPTVAVEIVTVLPAGSSVVPLPAIWPPVHVPPLVRTSVAAPVMVPPDCW